MRDICPQCGTAFREGALFCEACGTIRPSIRNAPPTGPQDWRTWALNRTQYQYVVPQRNWRSITRTISAFFMTTVVLSLVAALVTLIYGINMVLPEISDGYSYTLFIVLPVIVPLLELSGGVLQLYYLVLVAVIVASAAFLFLKSFRGFRDEITGKGKPREHSPFFEMCGLLFAVLFFNMVLVYLMLLFGQDVEVPGEDADVWEMLFLLANASVWEEIITRVLMIGVPLLLYDLMTDKLERKRHSYFLGGGFNLGASEVLLIVVSSLIFGLAHFEAWGAWKIAPSALAGLALGFMYLKYGLYASIMLHFAFDYLSMPADVFDSLAIAILTTVAVVIWAGIGAGFFTYYIVRIIEFFTESKLLEPKPTLVAVAGFYPGPYVPSQTGAPPYYGTYGPAQAPPPPPPQNQAGTYQSWGGGAYVCPVCGYTEARWVEGRFQCLRCGNLS